MPTLINFKIKSESLSADLEPTLHLVVQDLFSLDFDMQKTTSSMENSVAKSFILSLRENLKKRFPHFGTTNKGYAVGSMLHPYYRGSPLSLTQRLDDLFNEIINEDEETHEEEDPLMRASKAYQRPTTISRENAPQKSKIECEFELFMSHPHVKNEKSINLLEWWKKKNRNLPIVVWCCQEVVLHSSQLSNF